MPRSDTPSVRPRAPLALLRARRGRLLALAGLLAACAPPAPVPGGALDVALGGDWTSAGGAVRLPIPTAQGDLALTRSLMLPEGWDPDTRAVLRGHATGWRVRASVGGREIGTDAGGLRAFAVNLTGALRAGKNTLGLVVESPRPDNIVPGKTILTMTAYTYRQPAKGQVAARGEVWLELAEARRIDDLDVAYVDDVVRVSARVRGAEGEVVRFAVTRDGEELARLPDATVKDGVAEAEAPWRGPRWSLGGAESPFLQYVVATLPNGATRQVRFGARAVTRDAKRLALDGTPLYLAVRRHVYDGQRDARSEVAALAALYARAGLNAVELHAALAPDAFFAAADELGFPVVMTPRCDGRRQDDGTLRADDDWAAFVQEGNARIAAAGRDHPSVVLWNLEAPAEDGYPALYAPFSKAGAPVVDLRESNGFSDTNYVRMRAEAPLPAYINELAFKTDLFGGTAMLARLGALVAEHRAWGIGITLPHVLHIDATAPDGAVTNPDYLAGVQAMLAAQNVVPLPTGVRRGPAAVRVTAARADGPAEGEILVLEAPGQAPVAAATDASGVATIELDYAGVATLRVLGRPARTEVTLVPGRYADGRWEPSVVPLTLTLE